MEKTVKKKGRICRVILALLLIILLLVGAIAVFTAVNASKNMKVMNSTLDAGMETLSGATEVTPVDADEYSEIKMYKAKCHCQS